MIAIAQWQKTWQQLGVDGSAELYALIGTSMSNAIANITRS